MRPILLVEDDDVDAMSVKRALNDLKVINPLVHKQNGEEALQYLRTEGKNRCCIILLDLNMPKMNGVEFLKILKADEMLKKIPIVVLTTSEDEKDRIETFNLSVAGYMVKPADYKKFIETIRLIDLYWTLNELPNGG